MLFSARHPLVGIDKRIKRIASANIITNKVLSSEGIPIIFVGCQLRAPVDETMHILGYDVGLRGNERIRMEARAVNVTAGTDIRVATSVSPTKAHCQIVFAQQDDGSLRLSSRRIFLGSKWLSLPLSPSPALSASVDAFRVCLCRSFSAPERPKLFLVAGNKPCLASAAICQ